MSHHSLGKDQALKKEPGAPDEQSSRRPSRLQPGIRAANISQPVPDADLYQLLNLVCFNACLRVRQVRLREVDGGLNSAKGNVNLF